MTKLFIGGIPFSLTNEKLKELFEKYGTVSSAQIIMDKYTNQSKGFAFVEMPNDTEAQTAIKELDGFGLEGRKIGVSVARPREDRPAGGGFGRDNNRGGFDRNRGGSGGYNRDRR